MTDKFLEILTLKSYRTMMMISDSRTLATAMSNLNGATIVRLTTATTPKLRKGGNPFLDTTITKVVTQSCQFGYSYENAVNNRLEKSGEERTFESGSLPWGSWLVPNKLISHNGNIYGRFYTLPNPNMEIAYFVGERLATPEEVEIIKGLEPKRVSDIATQTASGLTEHQVQPMNYNLDTIVKMSADNIRYQCESLANAFSQR